MICTTIYELSWREVWYPMNWGTGPFWLLLLIWIFARTLVATGRIDDSKFREAERPVMGLFPVAVVWAFVHRMLELTQISFATGQEDHGVYGVGFDPNSWTTYLDMGAREFVGLAAAFAALVVVPSIARALWTKNKKTNAEQDGDGDA